jgi:cell shape-determining protein MreD
MITFYSLKKNFLKSIPLILLYYLSLNPSSLIKEFTNFDVFSFNIQMIIIYFYALKLPEYLDLGHVFLIGILKDTLIGTPLGTTSLSYLALCLVAAYIRNHTLRPSLTSGWFSFVPALFFSNFIYFMIINNFSNLSFYYIEVLRISFFTFLFFPIFYYFLTLHMRLYNKEK